MTGLLDRGEIGTAIMEHVLTDFIYFTVQMYHKLAHKDGSALESPNTKHADSKSHKIPSNARDMLLRHQGARSQKNGRAFCGYH